MKIYKKHPLLVKYLLFQTLVLFLSVAAGLAFTLVYIPYKKRERVVQEVVRACHAIERIEKDKNLAAKPALGLFLSINRSFFNRETTLKQMGDSDVVPQMGEKPICAPFWFPWHRSMLQIRVDPSTVLVTSILPPTRLQIQMIAEGEESSYEVQHHHPIIFGVTPETLSAMILVLFLIGGSCSSFVFSYIWFRRASAEAASVLDRLREGDLKARFTHGYDALGKNFNSMADEIEKLVNQLRDSEYSRQKILQELTHDLKTPVASLRGLLEAVRDKHPQMEKRELEDFLDTGVRETLYFARLVDDLLFISGVKEPAIKSETRKLDLALLIQNEMALFAKNEDVSARLNANGPAYLYGQEILLHRLFRNALDNAFSFARKEVSILLSSSDTHWQIEISNDGPSPSDEEIQQFGRKRGTRSIQSDHQGRISLGLGSVIMKKIAQSYGGDVTLERSPSEGAVLRIFLRK